MTAKPKPMIREKLPEPPNNCRYLYFPWMLGGTVHHTHGLTMRYDQGLGQFVDIALGPADAQYLRSMADWLETANGIESPKVDREGARKTLTDTVLKCMTVHSHSYDEAIDQILDALGFERGCVSD